MITRGKKDTNKGIDHPFQRRKACLLWFENLFCNQEVVTHQPSIIYTIDTIDLVPRAADINASDLYPPLQVSHRKAQFGPLPSTTGRLCPPAQFRTLQVQPAISSRCAQNGVRGTQPHKPQHHSINHSTAPQHKPQQKATSCMPALYISRNSHCSITQRACSQAHAQAQRAMSKAQSTHPCKLGALLRHLLDDIS